MVYFKEILPNPAGKDTEGEWIRLINTSNEGVNLSGWLVRDLSGKTFVLDTTLGKGEETTLDYSSTKIALNNNGDKLELVNSDGVVADTISYTSASDDEIIIASRFIEETRDAAAERPTLESVSLREGAGSVSGGEASAILVAVFLAIFAGIIGALFIKKSEQE